MEPATHWQGVYISACGVSSRLLVQPVHVHDGPKLGMCAAATHGEHEVCIHRRQPHIRRLAWTPCLPRMSLPAQSVSRLACT
jgi:hypothetical protein